MPLRLTTRAGYAAQLMVLGTVYFLMGTLGLRLGTVNNFATLLWAPTGLSIGALALGGVRLWPAIFVGAFAVNGFTGAPPWVAGGIALGNTGEALLGAFLIRRFTNFPPGLNRIDDVSLFLLLVAPLSAAVSASIGVGSLLTGGLLKSGLLVTWITWWLGDLLGCLTVTPMLIAWGTAEFTFSARSRWKEAATLVLMVLGICALVFGPFGGQWLTNVPRSFLIIFPMLAAALRFGQPGATAAILATSVLAIIGTANQFGPFARPNLNEGLLSLQMFMGIVSAMILVIGAESEERFKAEDGLRKSENRLEEKILQRTAQLETANRELEAFSYSVSHDLRTPLRAIDGFSRELMENSSLTLDARAQDDFRRIRAATQRMSRLIDDLLNFSRIGRREMVRERIDLSGLAEQVAESLRQESPGRAVMVVIETGLTAIGDAALMRIAFQNLIGNAWKFTSKTDAARIDVGQTMRNGVMAFFVRDNGAGFDLAFKDRLFGVFQRLHSEKEFPGTGIGLAMIQRIIHRHGGTIEADAQSGKGATFYFTLP